MGQMRMVCPITTVQNKYFVFVFVFYLHMKNHMESWFWSHKRLSFNETIRMIAGTLRFFFIMTMFQFSTWYYVVGLCTILKMVFPNLL